MELLLNDVRLELQGIFSGAWIMKEEFLIENEIFTKRVPLSNYEEAVKILPLLKKPQALISLCLFRKNALIHILKKLKEIKKEENRERYLIQ